MVLNKSYFVQGREYGSDITFKLVTIDYDFLSHYTKNGFSRMWIVFCGESGDRSMEFFGGHPLWF